MSNSKPIEKTKTILVWLVVFGHILILFSCKRDQQSGRLDSVIIHENPFIKIASRPEVLLDHLNNPAAPFFIGSRIIFAESGKGVVSEYKEKGSVPLIQGFGVDSYGEYPISVLGITSVPEKNRLIVAAAQDVGHIFLFDESTFPTTAAKGHEIELQRTEPSNPFGVLLIKNGTILVATGGTKSVYQAPFDVINPSPLRPVFDVPTGVEMMAEDTKTGQLYGAVVGTGQNDGYLIRWNPDAEKIQPETLVSGFTNLVGVLQMPNRLLLLLEFGSFEKSGTGRLTLIDPDNPGKIYPLVSGLDSPTGFALSSDNTLLISTFGKNKGNMTGMLLRLNLVTGTPPA
jgi:hypothetical protein